MIFRTKSEERKIEPQMAAMIDVVFLLLLFFMLTLKVIEPEGDFPINTANAGVGPMKRVSISPVRIELKVASDKTLKSVQFGGNKPLVPKPATKTAVIKKFMADNPKEFPVGYEKSSDEDRKRAARRVGEDRVFEVLRRQVAKYVAQQRNLVRDPRRLEKEMKAEIKFEYGLAYRYLVEATSACRARYVIRNGKKVRESLIKQVVFLRPTGSK